MRHNKEMSDKELTVLVQNEIEWRKMLWKKMEAIEKAQNHTENRIIRLEVKNAFFGSFFGAVGGALISYFKMKQ